MSLADPPLFRVAGTAPGHLRLQSGRGDVAHLFVLEEDIIRVMAAPGGRLNHPKTWAIAPGDDDVRIEGRGRFDLTGFSLPACSQSLEDGVLRIETAALRLRVRLAGFFCDWAMRVDEEWRQIAADRSTQAYDFGYWEGRVRHYLARAAGEQYFGLGERAGDMDRAGGRYEMRNIDAMGYNARTSDPLYKHIPFYITRRTGAGAFGLFYDTTSDCVFDLGQELDNYHGAYRSFTAQHGDLDYYVIAGPAVDQVTRRFTWLTGRPAFIPRWGLGYSGSTMTYTDAPNAQARMAEFLDCCARHDILCDSFHLSSGYTSIGDKRHVFHWNREKLPNPTAFVQSYADKGVRLCANIKPCLLRSHPLFGEAHAQGLLIGEADGEPAWVQFWGEIGAYLDFTNPAAQAWWKAKVKSELLYLGVAATWNDNNEFEIESPKALAHGFGATQSAREAKPLQALSMVRASRDAQIEHAPGKRPFLITRSGGVGLHRYAQTWSGDNVTSWETLKYNLKMGLGLALSGISNAGHDIGGFAGPAPDAELLVRWVQAGLLLPRFSIHSWNDDGSVTAPWMHQQATGVISELIKLRYRLIPYLYALMWRYHRDYQPVIRPVFTAFPDDPNCDPEAFEMMVGDALLVAPVVDPGQSSRAAYLPAGGRWYDFWSGSVFEGGRHASLPAPWDQPPILAREGCAIPLNIAEQHFSSRADLRGFAVFPHVGTGEFSAESYEDEGESNDALYGAWRIRVASNAASLRVAVEQVGWMGDPGRTATLIFPVGEARVITVTGGAAVESLTGGRRQVVVTLG